MSTTDFRAISFARMPSSLTSLRGCGAFLVPRNSGAFNSPLVRGHSLRSRHRIGLSFMASLKTLNKADLLAKAEFFEAEVARLQASESELTEVNKSLAEAIEDLQSAPAPAAQPAAAAESASVPADMMMTGMLRVVTPATYKDGTPVDGLFKVAIETSVSYTTGKDAAGKFTWSRVNGYKTVWFTASEEIAQPLLAQVELNEWTLVRCWYRYATKASNVVQKQVVKKDGTRATVDALQHPADLKALRIDVVTSGSGDAQDDNDVV